MRLLHRGLPVYQLVLPMVSLAEEDRWPATCSQCRHKCSCLSQVHAAANVDNRHMQFSMGYDFKLAECSAAGSTLSYCCKTIKCALHGRLMLC